MFMGLLTIKLRRNDFNSPLGIRLFPEMYCNTEHNFDNVKLALISFCESLNKEPLH